MVIGLFKFVKRVLLIFSSDGRSVRIPRDVLSAFGADALDNIQGVELPLVISTARDRATP
jgi:hypothetical protein